jgi:hypothetical protein
MDEQKTQTKIIPNVDDASLDTLGSPLRGLLRPLG